MKFPFTPASKQGLAEQRQAESDYFSELSSDFELEFGDEYSRTCM